MALLSKNKLDIQTVNGRYKGNLFNALKQPDIYAWAQSLGLIQTNQYLPKNMSSIRKTELSFITKDPSLTTERKFEILRSLLSGN